MYVYIHIIYIYIYIYIHIYYTYIHIWNKIPELPRRDSKPKKRLRENRATTQIKVDSIRGIALFSWSLFLGLESLLGNPWILYVWNLYLYDVTRNNTISWYTVVWYNEMQYDTTQCHHSRFADAVQMWCNTCAHLSINMFGLKICWFTVNFQTKNL